jgi:hypothetical protein
MLLCELRFRVIDRAAGRPITLPTGDAGRTAEGPARFTFPLGITSRGFEEEQ